MSRQTLSHVLDSNGERKDHWVDLSPMSGHDMVALASGDAGEILPRLAKAITAHDFMTSGEPADILDQPWETLRKMLPLWQRATEDDALPQP